MTDKNAQNRFDGAANAAFLKPVFHAAAQSLAEWGEKIAAAFPHADVEFFDNAGSKGKTGRAALKVMFTRAVIGEAKEHAAYAGFWVTAESNRWHDDVMYEIKPYRGTDDKFGNSHRSNELPRWFGFALPHTFWSLHDLPLHDEREGFRSGIEFSKDGRVPDIWRRDLNLLYYYGYTKGIFEDPVEVLAQQPNRPNFIPE